MKWLKLFLWLIFLVYYVPYRWEHPVMIVLHLFACIFYGVWFARFVAKNFY